MTELKSRNVFLDTDAFITNNFGVNQKPLSILAEHATEEETYLFVSDIVIQEVKHHIKTAVSQAVNAHDAFLSQARVLKNSKHQNISTTLTKMNKKDITTEIISQFEDFLNDNDVTILKATEVAGTAIFQAYFDGNPPFEMNHEKKEFPDAFTLEAIREWCKANTATMYVITTDKGITKACDQNGPLYVLSKVADFLDAFNDHLNRGEAAFIRQNIIKHKDEIIKRITRDFPDRGFILTNVDDFDAEVLEVTVQDVTIDDDNIDVVDIDKDTGAATINTTATITYQAELSYGDPTTAGWDSEDHANIYFETIEETVDREDDYEVDITVRFVEFNPNAFEIEDVILQIPSTVEVESDRCKWKDPK